MLVFIDFVEVIKSLSVFLDADPAKSSFRDKIDDITAEIGYIFQIIRRCSEHRDVVFPIVLFTGIAAFPPNQEVFRFDLPLLHRKPAEILDRPRRHRTKAKFIKNLVDIDNFGLQKRIGGTGVTVIGIGLRRIFELAMGDDHKIPTNSICGNQWQNELGFNGGSL